MSHAAALENGQASSAMATIETKNVTYTYPGATKPSIQDVTITIEKGEFALITGPSGCGKTTLCRCFNGLIPHFYLGELKGEINAAGLAVKDHQIHELAEHVGLVFQNPENQLFALSVEKDVAFGLENLGMPREEMRKRVDWAMELTGIYDLRERAPHELSGGQQQRVAIASVLAMQPEVMVLDEPTSFLDPLSAKRIFETIHDLNRTLGITVILVEHRLDLTAGYCNHIIIMDEGKVVLDGDPHEILNSEETRLIGVGIPKATRLFQTLEKDGINLNHKAPLSSDEMASLLKEALSTQ
jgi:energy-coupling factor transporter ATPase